MSELRLAGVGRITAGEMIFVAAPDWQDASDYHAGCLLRLRNQPIEACENGSQRRGWWHEHARQTYVPKPRKWNLVGPADGELPY